MHGPPDSHHCLLERLLRADEAVLLSSWLQGILQCLTHVHFNKNAILQNCDPTKIAIITQDINWLIESQYIIKDTKQTADARCIYILTSQYINWLIESQYIIKDTKQTADARCIYILTSPFIVIVLFLSILICLSM